MERPVPLILIFCRFIVSICFVAIASHIEWSGGTSWKRSKGLLDPLFLARAIGVEWLRHSDKLRRAKADSTLTGNDSRNTQSSHCGTKRKGIQYSNLLPNGGLHTLGCFTPAVPREQEKVLLLLMGNRSPAALQETWGCLEDCLCY